MGDSLLMGFRTLTTQSVVRDSEPSVPQPNTKKDAYWRLSVFGWGTGIRTPEVTESESVALPLGDAPMFTTT